MLMAKSFFREELCYNEIWENNQTAFSYFPKFWGTVFLRKNVTQEGMIRRVGLLPLQVGEITRHLKKTNS